MCLSCYFPESVCTAVYGVRYSIINFTLECMLCDDECESVAHVLWYCSAYNIIRKSFIIAIEELLHLLGIFI